MFINRLQQLLRFRCFTLILGSLFLCTTPVMGGSEDTGTTAMDFLRLGHSVKSVALGNALTAEGGLDGLTLNPASLAKAHHRQAQFQYVQYIQDVTYTNVSGVYPTTYGAFGTNVGLIDFGSSLRTTLTDQSGSSGQTFSNSGYQVQVAYAHELHNWDVGAAVRYASLTLDSRKADAAGLDMGVQRVLNHQWSVGASVTNITLKKQKFIVQEAELPQTVHLGAKYNTVFGMNPLAIYGELGHPSDDQSYYALGSDLLVNDRLHLRAGYTTFGDAFHPSLGVGLDVLPFTIDFTYRPTQDLGETYRFGVSMVWED